MLFAAASFAANSVPLQHIRCAAVTIPLIGKHVREADRESRILKRSTRSCLDVLALQARGERLRQLVGFLRVRHSQRVHVLRAPDLELGAVGALADLHKLGVPPSLVAVSGGYKEDRRRIEGG